MIKKKTLRELQAKAIEKRLKENDSRGIKNPESVKKMQQKKEEMDRVQYTSDTKGGLKWQVG